MYREDNFVILDISDERYRGKRIGKRVMIQLCRIVHAGDAIIRLHTREWNENAQKLYEKLGAKIINEKIYFNGMKHIGMQYDKKCSDI